MIKAFKKIYVILKFVVCKPNPDIENVTYSEESKPLINGGKNAI